MDPAPLPEAMTGRAGGAGEFWRTVRCSRAPWRLAISAVARAFAVVSAATVSSRDAAMWERELRERNGGGNIYLGHTWRNGLA